MEDYGQDCPLWVGEASDTFHLFLIAAYSQWFGNVVTSGDLNRTYYVSDPELYDLEARVSWLNGLTPPRRAGRIGLRCRARRANGR